MITISRRDLPFSTREGCFTLLPCTNLSLQVFPGKVFFYQAEEYKGSFIVEQHGPFTDFLCTTNLEKARVEVRAKGEKGFFCYALKASSTGVQLQVLRGEAFSFSWGKEKVLLKNKQTYEFSFALKLGKITEERLSLGVHKKQEVESIQKRKDLKELVPLWLKVGQMLPPLEKKELKGLQSLLEEAKKTSDKREIEAKLKLLLTTSFTGFFVPHSEDQTHQNLGYTKDPSLDPYLVLQEGAFFLRSLFLQEGKQEISFLPKLPSFAVCGRFCHVFCKWGKLDLEWRKFRLRRVLFQADQGGQVFIEGSFQRYRVRKNLQEKGVWLKKENPLSLEKNTLYYLDRFESCAHRG